MDTPLSVTPRGIRNNNPCNIRTSKTFVWQGQTSADKEGFCIFKSPLWGMRAACVIWTNYQMHSGCVTLSDYIRRWAPSNENDTEAYIEYVATKVGSPPWETLDIHNLAVPLLDAVIRYENGQNPYTHEQMLRAVSMAHLR